MSLETMIVTRAGTRVAPLDAEIEAVSWALNGHTQTSVRFDPETAGAQHLQLGGSHEIQVWDDAGLLWWGVPIGVGNVGPSGDVELDCANLEIHLASRRVVADLRFDDVDQLAIGSALIQHAQQVPPQSGDADLNIAVATFEPSGVRRDRSYHADERSEILHLLGLLSGVRGGPDWEVRPFADGRREWTPLYPTRGPVVDTLEWDVDGARGVVDWSGTLDGQVVNEAHVSGDEGDDEESGDRPWGYWVDTAARARDGLRSHVEAGSDGTTDLRTLNDRARRIVDARKDPVPTLKLVVEATDVTVPRDVRPGDRFAVRIRRGFYSVDEVVKVVQASYRPPTGTCEVEVVRWVT